MRGNISDKELERDIADSFSGFDHDASIVTKLND